MSSTCITSGYPYTLKQLSLSHMAMPTLPTSVANWQHQRMYQVVNNSSSERRDSGVHSSSEGQASSPGSDDSEMYSYRAPPEYRYHDFNMRTNLNMQIPSPRFILPIKTESNIDDGTRNLLTPPNSEPSTETNPLRSLQMSVEQNLSLSSPEHNSEDNQIADNNNEDFVHQEDYNVPTLNSHGKIKKVKCKQCQLVFKTKLEFWTHQREHIKPDRLLECEKCPFVTEYKHHLEYHMRNHGGEKPYACNKCDYKCVNKSMLNSHMKSHSNVYQYRCATCHYTSKYCHSLKLHLRKYQHLPDMVLNPDGTPNPAPIIDVYGTRRGPKLKNGQGEQEGLMESSPKRIRTGNSPPAPAMPQPLPPMHPGLQQLPPLHLMAQSPDMQLKFMLQQAFLMQTLQMMQGSSMVNPNPLQQPSTTSSGSISEDSALDLSRSKSPENTVNMETPSHSTDEDDEERLNLLYKVKVEHDVDDAPAEVAVNEPSTSTESKSTPSDTLKCPHCCITFDDIALYTIHMRFHNYSDPFTCNSCGQKCDNKIEFTVHIFSRPH